MGNQQKRGYFSEFFKQWHFITALLVAAVLTTLLFADIQYDLLPLFMAESNTLFVTMLLVAVVTIFVFSVTLVVEACKPNVNLADDFGWGFILTGIIYAVTIYLNNRITVIRTSFTVFTFIFGIVLVILSAVAHRKAVRDGVAKVDYDKTLAGYYAMVFGKYSFLIVPAIAFFVAISVYCYITAPKAGVGSIFPEKIYYTLSIICLAFIAIYLLISLIRKRVGMFDVYLVAALFSAPVVAGEVAISGISAEDKKIWLLVTAAIFGLSIICTIIRRFRFDPKVSALSILARKKNYFAQLSARYTLFGPIAAGLMLFFITFIAFRFTQLSLYMEYLNGNKPDYFFGSIPYLFVNGASYFFLLLSGLIALGSINSKVVCAGDALLMMCAGYAVMSLVSMIFIATSPIALYIMLAFLAYVIVLSCIRIVKVTKAAKEVKD